MVVAVAPSLEAIHQHWMYIQHNIHLEQVGADSAESLASFVEIKFSALANAEKEVEEDEKVDQYLVHSLDSTMASAVCNDKKMGRRRRKHYLTRYSKLRSRYSSITMTVYYGRM